MASYFNQTPIGRHGTLLEEGQKAASKGKRKLFGKAPWHRKESSKSASSAGSSIREILRGKSPRVSPVERARSAGKHRLGVFKPL